MRTIIITFLTTLAIMFGLAGIYAAAAHAEPVHRCTGYDYRTASADGHDTSCMFAHNVRQAWFGQPGNPVYAYSPVTGQVYRMVCAAGFDLDFDNGSWVTNATRCMDADGGNAVAYVW